MKKELATRCPFQVRAGYWCQKPYGHDGHCEHTIYFGTDVARKRELEREFGEPPHMPKDWRTALNGSAKP